MFELLYPNPHAVRGLDDCDFEGVVGRDEVDCL